MLNFIVWDMDPEIFSIGSFSIRWYGLLWATAILLGWELIKKIFKHEHCPNDWADKLFVYGVIGIIAGARLGHCFFYEPAYYLAHPLEIFAVWQGGLASHGAAIGLLIVMYLYNKNVSKKGYLWILDRLVIGVAIGGALIRLGNLMNSEIYGSITSLPWGFIFVRAGETEPMHPTQIYEAFYCIITFIVIYWMYWKKESYKKPGLIFGVFLLGIFGTRFLLEFIKLDQVSFEGNMLLNMGQVLSLPFVIWGVILIIRAEKKGVQAQTSSDNVSIDNTKRIVKEKGKKTDK